MKSVGHESVKVLWKEVYMSDKKPVYALGTVQLLAMQDAVRELPDQEQAKKLVEFLLERGNLQKVVDMFITNRDSDDGVSRGRRESGKTKREMNTALAS